MTYVDRLLTAEPPLRAQMDGHVTDRTVPAASSCPELAPLLSVLFLLIDETRSIVVNLTSAHAGAGASTVARRVAEAAASTGWCRVALLDAKPQPGELGHGLIDAIERGHSPVLSPQRIGALEIDAGRLSTAGQPCSRIESVRKLYGTLRDRYSLVIVDCPAVFAGQQTLMVAAAADETVLVLEAERTALADVGRARAALERRGAGVLGMVMNKSRARVPAMFGGRT
ncbi:MAG: hypothetical protein ACRYF2_10055 [Janthinobacterium lividum]